MATTTRVLTAAVNGTVYTTNANDALEAIDTCHSGATAPTDEVANGKLWLDTTATPGTLKVYNNATWEVVLSATGAAQTKLDTIEAAADVTDVTNVTAAGALMDSEVTNLAQVKAFSSADYATAAQGTLAGTALQATSTLDATKLSGVLPALDGSALTGISLPTTYGAVGTYGLFATAVAGAGYAPGGTIAGSGLYPANTYNSGDYIAGWRNANKPSGTWQCMGQTNYVENAVTAYRSATVSVWVRIS